MRVQECANKIELALSERWRGRTHWWPPLSMSAMFWSVLLRA
jgi:hypothetical protein